MVVLYHHGSSACAAKTRFALDEKGLSWESHYVDLLRGEQFKPEFLAINPKGVVPVLVHDGAVIRESTVICEYLEEVFPSPRIYPASPTARARVRCWTKAVDEELHPACSALTYVVSHRHTILRNGVGSFEQFLEQGGPEGRAARALKWQWIHDGIAAPGAAEKIRLYDGYLHAMESALGDSEWLGGNEFSMADIALAPYVNRIQALSMHEMWTEGRLPRLERWFQKVQERPAFKSALLDWMPEELRDEMRQNGEKSWPAIRKLLQLA
jgi:glutathione S-transferase